MGLIKKRERNINGRRQKRQIRQKHSKMPRPKELHGYIAVDADEDDKDDKKDEDDVMMVRVRKMK